MEIIVRKMIILHIESIGIVDLDQHGSISENSNVIRMLEVLEQKYD